MKHSHAQAYHQIERDRSGVDVIRNKLKLKKIESEQALIQKHPHVVDTIKEMGGSLSKLRDHSAKIITTGILSGSVLFSSGNPGVTSNTPVEVIKTLAEGEKTLPVRLPENVLKDALSKLPQKPHALSREEEKSLEQVIFETTGIPARATLEGEHLNTTYGYIGAEQHLRRYPGDTIAQHAPTPTEYGGDNPTEILKEGIAPGLGAWGYFAPSKEALTDDLKTTEQWYAVVQTLYLPDWAKRQPYLRDWYKYRKVIIVNTVNGNAVVAAIADAGPAAWTGKHFGGSPEVMDYLGGARYKKGAVILFFVDDPENKIPLGPVDYQTKSSILNNI